MRQNELEPRRAFNEFFNDADDTLDIASLVVPIKRIAKLEDVRLFDGQFTLAEAVVFIHWLSHFDGTLDLANNPNGIIDILTDKLQETLAKLAGKRDSIYL
jgi:hypothetical protein